MTLLFGYKEGDTIDPQLQKHLGLQDDKVYIIDFFASWCSSCEKEIPLISKANQQIDKAHVEIIGIDVDKSAKKANAFQESLRKDGLLDFRVINDPMNLIIGKFEPIGMPALYYVKDGKVLAVIYGAIDDIDKQILKDLESL